MVQHAERVRLQIPVNKEFADYIAKLGECVKWTQAATAAKLLEDGIKSQNKLEDWLGDRFLASIANAIRGKRRIRVTGAPPVYMQTFVEAEVVESIELMSRKLKNSPVRTAALVLELAAFDNGWVIEALGTGPGQALAKFINSVAAKKFRERIVMSA